MPVHEEKIPHDPIEFIRSRVLQGKVLWTYHVNMRLRSRFIPREAILESVNKYEIIEEYPRDKYSPSYLVYSQYQQQRFHILFAADLEGDNVRVITVYRPSTQEWETDLKKRRRP